MKFLKKYAKYAILLLAVVMAVYGLERGEADTVLKKAANICLECIGIG